MHIFEITLIIHYVMKRFTYALLAGCIALFLSCNKEKELQRGEYDLLPTCIVLNVVDESGNNLIDPEFSGNILGNEITMEHDGKVYERLDNCSEYEDIKTKALPPAVFNGLQTYHPKYSPDKMTHCLIIGYYDRTSTIERNEYTINWGDGSKDVIAYSQSFQWVADYDEMREVPDSRQNTWLNGTALESNVVTIVK